MEIKLPRSYYRTNDRIYNASKVNLMPGLSVIVGCNGCGKTTFQKLIAAFCKEQNIPLFTYDNLHDGGSKNNSQLLHSGRISMLAQNLTSSEGEVIANNLTSLAQNISAFVKHAKSISVNQIVIMLDAVDSGSSIDNIIELKEFLKFIIQHETDDTFQVYVIISANSYETANGEQCIDITHGKYVTFDSYDEYRQFILDSRKLKNKRYKRPSSNK